MRQVERTDGGPASFRFSTRRFERGRQGRQTLTKSTRMQSAGYGQSYPLAIPCNWSVVLQGSTKIYNGIGSYSVDHHYFALGGSGILHPHAANIDLDTLRSSICTGSQIDTSLPQYAFG